MKRTALLHAELSHAIASLGHGDMLVIGDVGLPIPPGPRRIDLALTPASRPWPTCCAPCCPKCRSNAP